MNKQKSTNSINNYNINNIYNFVRYYHLKKKSWSTILIQERREYVDIIETCLTNKKISHIFILKKFENNTRVLLILDFEKIQSKKKKYIYYPIINNLTCILLIFN